VQTPPDDYTPVSTLSLQELRTQMLQSAAIAAARARAHQARGDVRGAQALKARAQHLLQAARSVNVG
jgi:hypothetical protein